MYMYIFTTALPPTPIRLPILLLLLLLEFLVVLL